MLEMQKATPMKVVFEKTLVVCAMGSFWVALLEI